MKRIYVMLCAALFFGGRSHATTDLSGASEPKKGETQTSLFSEKVTGIDKGTLMDEEVLADVFADNGFFEKKQTEETIQSDDLVNNDDDKKIILNESDRKLYAPPPGEDGNPQKIVTPLGTGEIPFFLLLSVLTIGFYFRFKKT